VGWKSELSQEPKRSQSILALLSAAVFLALPIPILDPVTFEAGVLLALWLSLGSFSYVCFYHFKWAWRLGALSFVLALIHALVTDFWIVFACFIFLLLWARRRFSKVVLTFIAIFSFQSFGQVAGLPFAPEFKLDALASCGSLDKIPWNFRPDGRRIRKLFEEELRLANDNETFWWELYQVMNRAGEVTFIFRRSLPDGSYISLAARDFKFVRVHSTPESSKKLENQTFKHLINRPALIFYRSDGTVVNYLPGSVGKATIQIQFAMTTGAYLPPVYIRGNFCDRPASLSEADVAGKSFGAVKNQGKAGKDGDSSSKK